MLNLSSSLDIYDRMFQLFKNCPASVLVATSNPGGMENGGHCCDIGILRHYVFWNELRRSRRLARKIRASRTTTRARHAKQSAH
jgi:hypothetical protein